MTRSRSRLAFLFAFLVAACSSPAESAEPTSRPRSVPASCTTAGDCPSGSCEGAGCGTPDGRCVDPEDRLCAEAVTQWCGCDGKTVTTNTGCAGMRYLHTGPCQASSMPVQPEPEQPTPQQPAPARR